MQAKLEDARAARVLVVEVDYFIASDLAGALPSLGLDVIGPFGDEAEAARAIAGTPPDLALLDIDLHGSASYTLADRLAAQGVPHAFMTGYDRCAIPVRYAHVPRYEKTVCPLAVARAVEELGAGAGYAPAEPLPRGRALRPRPR